MISPVCTFLRPPVTGVRSSKPSHFPAAEPKTQSRYTFPVWSLSVLQLTWYISSVRTTGTTRGPYTSFLVLLKLHWSVPLKTAITGRRRPLNFPGSKDGLDEGSRASGGRKKKSGLPPSCAPSETRALIPPGSTGDGRSWHATTSSVTASSSSESLTMGLMGCSASWLADPNTRPRPAPASGRSKSLLHDGLRQLPHPHHLDPDVSCGRLRHLHTARFMRLPT